MIRGLFFACALLLGLSLLLLNLDRGPVQALGGQGESLAPAAASPAEWGPVPAFSLTDQTGAALSLEDLRGAPFALAAIFSTCSGPCPMITRHMWELQQALQDTGVRLISVSVDPETDTPEVLAAYAKSYAADTQRWSFLTGAEFEIFELLKGGLWLGVERAEVEQAVLGMQVSHAAKIVAVDAQGRKRGWYDGEDPQAMQLLEARLRFLDEERK